MMQVASLIKNGIDIDVAMALNPDEALAWAVMFGELEGGVWNWDTLSWVERD